VPGGHGLDDLVVEDQGDPRLLAFSTSLKRPRPDALRSTRDCVDDDPATRAIFEEVLRDEVFHMNYSYQQLGRLTRSFSDVTSGVRAAPRLWNRYLRVVAAIAGLIANTLLTGIYFMLLPPFAWAARRAERRDTPGWRAIAPGPRRVADQPVLT
jgi:hypothetical protein